MSYEGITNIAGSLDTLAVLRSQIESLNAVMNEKISSLMPPEILQEIEETQIIYGHQIEQLKERAAEVEAAIKEEVIKQGATVKGASLQAVFVKGRVTWDTKFLEFYGQTINPGIFKARKEGEPTVSIRAIKRDDTFEMPY